MKVVLDLGVAKSAKTHRDRNAHDALEAGGRPQHRNTGVEHDRATTHRAQLRHCAVMRARFAQRRAVEVGHLVRADDDRVGLSPSHGTRLGQRQAQDEFGRLLAGQRGFVDLR